MQVVETNNTSLLHLDLSWNRIEGAEGGRHLSLLLQSLTTLKDFKQSPSWSGPLGSHALAPGLAAAARHLEVLDVSYCLLRNDGVVSLIPDGQVNSSLFAGMLFMVLWVEKML